MAKGVVPTTARRNGVQSIEVGSQLLETLAGAAGPLHLRDLAAGAGMSASKARRYLVSLLRCGLVAQDTTTARYDLGPMAMRIGLTALSRRHVVRVATEAVIELNQEIDRTILLSIWTDRGPFIIGWYDSSEIIICNLNVGSSLPLLTSASGRLFLAYLPRAATQWLVDAELASAAAQEAGFPIRSETDIRTLLIEIRKQRKAATREMLVPGLSAFAAPVFDHEGRIVATIAMIGPPGTVEPQAAGASTAALQRRAEEVSRRLGFHSDQPGTSLSEWLEARDAGHAAEPPPALAIPAAPPRQARKVS